jgi:Ni,Fe-hydrogenase III large subunit
VRAGTGVEGWVSPENLAGPAETFAGRLARLDPLAPISYRVLALRILEDATGVSPDEPTALARVGALERERAASHLGWLASFGHLIGYGWLERRAARLQLALLRAEGVSRLRSEAGRLSRRVERTPLLRRRLGGIGRLPDGAVVSGPVARASGVVADARTEEEAYRSLGFEPVVLDGDGALARLRVRLAEVDRSLDLVERAGPVSAPEAALDGAASGTGTAAVETPRGTARLRVTLEQGAVTGVDLDTPSAPHLELVEYVAEQQELADALVGVASLDISPWEVVR